MKKMVLLLGLLISSQVFATELNYNPVDNPKELNKPTVGGRQSGSEQVFGNPKLVGGAGQKYDRGPVANPNKATVGSRQSGSEQVFGNPKLVGGTGQKYDRAPVANPNKATVGGRQSGSEQVFGNPGNPKAD